MSEMQSIISGTVIPKDLAGVDGLETGFRPPTSNETRLLITGSPGAGKSTLLNSNKSLLMIDVERGGRTVADPAAMRFSAPVNADPVAAVQVYRNFVDRLITRKLAGKNDVLMIGFDSADELIALFQRALCIQAGVTDVGDIGGGHGKGYFQVRDDFAAMLDRIHAAGLGWAVIAHTLVKTVKVGEEERQVSSLAISDSYKSMLIRKCEHFLFVESGVELVTPPPIVRVVNGKRHEKPQPPEPRPARFLKTAPGGIWHGAEATELKIRVPLPDRIKLPQRGGFETFSKAYDAAVVKLMETSNVE